MASAPPWVTAELCLSLTDRSVVIHGSNSHERPARKPAALLAALILLAAATLHGQGRQQFGKVSFPLGRVEARTGENADWQRVSLNHELFVGDFLKTHAKSRAEITLRGGGKMRISENSELELTQAKVAGLKKDFGATLSKGQVWVAAKAAFGESKNVAVRTPTAVAAIRGTTYRAVADTAMSSVLLYDGEVDVIWAGVAGSGGPQDQQQGQGPQGGFQIGAPQEVAPPEQVPGPFEVSLEDWITLVAGMQVNVRSDGKYSLFEFDQAADSQLEFVRWNMERDSLDDGQ